MAPGSSRLFFGVSLAIHVALGAALYRGVAPLPARDPAAPPEPEALFAGDTFDVPDEVPAPEVTPEAPAPDAKGAEPARPSALPATRSPRSHAPREARAGGGESTEGTVFGASTDRASIDLATAFTRGFPQAASADPKWLTAPYGSAGEATVVLELDEAGALASSRVEGSPSAALRAGIARTLVLIGARAFTAGQRVTRLRVAGRVTADAVHDGLHGEVFAVGGSFDRGVGSAFFALSIGRRVDLRVTE